MAHLNVHRKKKNWMCERVEHDDRSDRIQMAKQILLLSKWQLVRTFSFPFFWKNLFRLNPLAIASGPPFATSMDTVWVHRLCHSNLVMAARLRDVIFIICHRIHHLVAAVAASQSATQHHQISRQCRKGGTRTTQLSLKQLNFNFLCHTEKKRKKNRKRKTS